MTASSRLRLKGFALGTANNTKSIDDEGETAISKRFWFISAFIVATLTAIWLTNPGQWRSSPTVTPTDDPALTEEADNDNLIERTSPLAQIPILMYHVIGDGSGSLAELYVNPEVFASQLEYLYDNGYNTITLRELYDHWQTGAPLPARPIILTFDDGYRSDYELAFPALRQYGFRAVHFLYVKKFDHPNSLTLEEIAELVDAGHEIGNHSYNHLELHTASPASLRRETREAKAALEGLLGLEITSFAYPVGRYNADAVKAVAESGHLLAVTTEYGYASPEQGLLTLKRVRINRSDGLQGFINKLKRYEELEPRRDDKAN